jgi:tRNA(His) 5'-end guanylyltransferase
MLGQTYFSHSELNKKKSSDIQEMLYSQKNINFNDMPIPFKRGVACRKMHVDCLERACGYKTQWTLDYQIPLFSHCNFYITNEIPRLD